MELKQAPVFRMYQLTVSEKNLDDFVQAGVNNLVTSYQNEPGTLAMYATHEGVTGTNNYVFEIYQDLKHYQVHAASPQFKNYANVAKKVVISKQAQELKPQFLQSFDSDLVIAETNEYLLKISHFSVDVNEVTKFKQRLNSALKSRDSALVKYLATIDNDETQWLKIDLFTNQSELMNNKSTTKPTIARFARRISTEKFLKVDTAISRKELFFNGLIDTKH